MKFFAKLVLSLANKLYLLLSSRFEYPVLGSRFLFTSIKSDRGNKISLSRSRFHRVKVRIEGKLNTLSSVDADVSDTNILITGDGNELSIGQGVELRGAKVVIRGSACSISIGSNTTIAGVRIVNVGQGCEITIGKDCMFSDQVEIWASDTHPIYDGAGKIINPESPIKVGDGVWVGSRAMLLKGVYIGNGSIVGMGTVVTSDIPENSISVGHPNRTIRRNIAWSKHYPHETMASPKL